jgi:hypothetical protein
VTAVLDRAKAMEFYPRIAGDEELSRQATEIRLRAERRLGEMMAEQKATVGMNEGGRPKTGSPADPVSVPTLAEAGIDCEPCPSPTHPSAINQSQRGTVDGP